MLGWNLLCLSNQYLPYRRLVSVLNCSKSSSVFSSHSLLRLRILMNAAIASSLLLYFTALYSIIIIPFSAYCLLFFGKSTTLYCNHQAFWGICSSPRSKKLCLPIPADFPSRQRGILLLGCHPNLLRRLRGDGTSL